MIAAVHMSRLGRFSIILLSAAFFATFFFFMLPTFPVLRNHIKNFGWVLPGWNLPGPLMFILTYRIHALRILREKALGKKTIFGIPFWVKFWFYTSVAISFLTIFYVCALIALEIVPLFYPATLAGLLLDILWIALLFSTLSFSEMSYKRKFAKIIDCEREKEKKLLYLTSVVFLLFTVYPSLASFIPQS
ncbi:MAG: hypothetical protein QW179_05515 [Candidatus Hadarchaeales archaeon]